MSLLDVQQLFWNAVRARRAPAELSQVFVSRGALSAVARMQIYRSAYWSRHEKCLQETYPRVFERVGASAFRALVASYIERFPSSVPSIEHAGRAFPDHLATDPQGDRCDPLLADLARLEWARVLALMAADAPRRFDAAALADPAASERPLCTAPSLSVLHVQASALSDADAATHAERRIWIAVWRGPTGLKVLEVDDEQGRALERAARGESLAAVCSEFVEPRAVERALAALTQWVRRSWITS